MSPKSICILSLVIWGLCLGSAMQPAQAAGETLPLSYRIVAEDVLQIQVADHPELSVTVTVIDDGTVTLPLAGSIKVGGLTVDQMIQKLNEIYNQRFVANPSIAINLVRTQQKKFYVYGEVRAPGAYPFSEGISVLRAVVTAGGFTDFANKRKVKILRQKSDVKKTLKVNIKKIERGNQEEDLEIAAGDIIAVPKGWF